MDSLKCIKDTVVCHLSLYLGNYFLVPNVFVLRGSIHGSAVIIVGAPLI